MNNSQNQHFILLPVPILVTVASYVNKPAALFQTCAKWLDISRTTTLAIEWLWNTSAYVKWQWKDASTRPSPYPLSIMTPEVLVALLKRMESFLALLDLILPFDEDKQPAGVDREFAIKYCQLHW